MYHFGLGVLARCYTEGFCNKLLDCYEGRGPFQPCLRQKLPVNYKASDRRIFAEMPLGDVWLESGIHLAWDYIYSNRHLNIPDSWVATMKQFDDELKATVLWLQLIPNRLLVPQCPKL